VCSFLTGLLYLLFVIYHDQQHQAILPRSRLRPSGRSCNHERAHRNGNYVREFQLPNHRDEQPNELLRALHSTRPAAAFLEFPRSPVILLSHSGPPTMAGPAVQLSR
jgi:hypothetical protein